MAKAKQDSFIKHNVEKGETIYSIARKYQTTPFDIYRLNPDAKNGIVENTILLIPKKGTQVVKQEVKTIVHEVKAKETLYSIAKEYEVTVAQLEEWNEELLKDGLKKGQEIIVSKEALPLNESFVEIKNVKNTKEMLEPKVMQESIVD